MNQPHVFIVTIITFMLQSFAFASNGKFTCQTSADSIASDGDQLKFSIQLGKLEPIRSVEEDIKIWFTGNEVWRSKMAWRHENVIKGTSDTILKRYDFVQSTIYYNQLQYGPYVFTGRSGSGGWSEENNKITDDGRFEVTVASGPYRFDARISGILKFDPMTSKYKGKAALSYGGIGQTEEQVYELDRGTANSKSDFAVDIECDGPATRSWYVNRAQTEEPAAGTRTVQFQTFGFDLNQVKAEDITTYVTPAEPKLKNKEQAYVLLSELFLAEQKIEDYTDPKYLLNYEFLVTREIALRNQQKYVVLEVLHPAAHAGNPFEGKYIYFLLDRAAKKVVDISF